ncbi:MAG TPA: hypothetical protein VFO10_14985 [Oligoflexus sp.]|uniref:hypothetical protein n=1 Tax=Oligoflexus sp. TaxID=1971216 RepID=UPI002D7FDC7D|nr:hypothetical protein [Oligoflexus sp.]HET9238564.1 hypothetical protein [Oligoflexus sp.]
MGASRANREWVKRAALVTLALSLGSLTSCKHRRGPSVPEEWDPSGLDARATDLRPVLKHSKSLRLLELFEDGFVITDTLTFRLDLQSSGLEVERRFDPVPFTPNEPILIQNTSALPARVQEEFLARLGDARVRQVPRCNPYGAVDGGYGGRFLILVDRSGQEHRFGASDAECAASDHDCSGACISLDAMNQVVTTFTAILPIPEKTRTSFTCAVDSPLPCSQPEFAVYGAWEGSALRSDIRRVLAERLCNLSAFSLEPGPDGSWLVQSSSREIVGTVKFNTQNRTVSCLTRAP